MHCRIRCLAFLIALAALPVKAEKLYFGRDIVPILSRAGCNSSNCHARPDDDKPAPHLTVYASDPQADYAVLTQADDLSGLVAAIVEKHRPGLLTPEDEKTLRQWIHEGAPGPNDKEPTCVKLTVDPPSVLLAKKDDVVALRIQATWSDGRKTDVSQYVKIRVAFGDAVKASNEAAKPAPPKGRTSVGCVLTAEEPGRAIVSVAFLDQVVRVPVAVRFDLEPEKGKSPTLRQSAPWQTNNYIDEHLFEAWNQVGLQPASDATDAQFLRRTYLHAIGNQPDPTTIRRFLGKVAEDRRPQVIADLLQREEFPQHWAAVWTSWLTPAIEHKESDDRRNARKKLREWLVEQFKSDVSLLDIVEQLFRLKPLDEPARSAMAALYEDESEQIEAMAALFWRRDLLCSKCHRNPSDGSLPGHYQRLMSTLLSDKDQRLKKADPLSGLGPYDELLHLQKGELRLTDKGREAIAQGLANLYWQKIFGKVITENLYGHRVSSNGAWTMEPLLTAIADDIIKHRFDSRHLLSTILTSRTYQRSSEARAPADWSFFSRYTPHRIRSDVLATMFGQILLVEIDEPVMASSLPSMPWGVPSRRDRPCNKEASTLRSALHLINSSYFQEAISSPRGRINRLIIRGTSDQRIQEDLFLATLCRPSKADERKMVQKHLTTQTQGKTGAALFKARRTAFEDLLWALINTKEFLFYQ